jgi:hypothetical protein
MGMRDGVFRGVLGVSAGLGSSRVQAGSALVQPNCDKGRALAKKRKKKMRKLLLTLGALMMAAAPAHAAKPRDGEAELAKAIEGRIAGTPVDCVNLRNVRSSQIIDHTAIVYDTGSTLYVNRPRAGRESLDRWDTLVTKTFSSDLCSIDVVQLWDSGSRMQSGTVFLGEFVPYKRAPKHAD